MGFSAFFIALIQGLYGFSKIRASKPSPTREGWGIVSVEQLLISICNVVKAAAIAKTTVQEVLQHRPEPIHSSQFNSAGEYGYLIAGLGKYGST